MTSVKTKLLFIFLSAITHFIFIILKLTIKVHLHYLTMCVFISHYYIHFPFSITFKAYTCKVIWDNHISPLEVFWQIAYKSPSVINDMYDLMVICIQIVKRFFYVSWARLWWLFLLLLLYSQTWCRPILPPPFQLVPPLQPIQVSNKVQSDLNWKLIIHICY